MHAYYIIYGVDIMKEIKKYLDTRIGEYSFYFEDIDSGYTYSLNDKAIIPAASCIKLPIAMYLLKEVEANKVTLSEKVFIKEEEKVSGSGIIHELDDREYSIEELLKLMIIQSDNTAANKLIDILGFDNMNNAFKTMELKNTFLKRKMGDVQAREKGLQNLSSSFDLAQCFKMLHLDSYLQGQYSQMLLSLLKRTQNRVKIPYYIPKREWHNIGNKSGSLSGIENDAALFNTEKGNFVFVAMSKSLPNNIYGIVTLSRMGKMMWDIVERNWK
jgi:beta-lactamase class A